MTTVEEILRQSGFTDDQIKGLDPKAITAFSGVLSTADRERQEAQQARDAAELAQRSNIDFYENKIAPSLTTWEEEKQRIENKAAQSAAEAAFYRTQAEEAKKSGFIAGEAPGFDASKFVPPNPGVQPRDQSGRYVAGVPGGTPGSPQFFDVNKVYERAGDAVSVLTDIQWEHQKLFNQPLPISPSELIRQADSVKLDPRTYAARTFNWDVRRQQMQADQEKEKNAKIAAETAAPLETKIKEMAEEHKKALVDRDREWAERIGSNPDIRRPMPSQFSDHQRAIKANEMPNPLDLNDTQRRQLTSQMIRKDIESQQVQ
jgi:hypothetical protein